MHHMIVNNTLSSWYYYNNNLFGYNTNMKYHSGYIQAMPGNLLVIHTAKLLHAEMRPNCKQN
jgi:hypothetical protein